MNDFAVGDVLIEADGEPPRGTIILGAQNDAWQRRYQDGRWLSVNYGQANSWGELLAINMGSVSVLWVYE